MKRVISLSMRPRNVELLLLVLMAAAHALSATTLVVGNCKSGGYDTIQHAISAAPAGATVQVCPGTYPEQVIINKAVTLAGIIASNGDQAYVYPPSGGLKETTKNAYGNYVAYQILVQNSSGAVNISNLYVSGNGNNVSGSDIAGIFYQNSPGIINGVVADEQSGNGYGVGIWLEGGSSSPSVTVENSYVRAFDFAGIFAETAYKPDTELTAKITSNFVLVDTAPGILLESGTTATVTNNSVSGRSGSSVGLVIGLGAAGSVSGNNVEQTDIGIQNYADGVSVTSNRVTLLNSGIDLQTPIGAVKGNILIHTLRGINFNCNANPNVRSNTINFSTIGLDKVPSGVGTGTNKIFNTGTVRNGGC